MKVISKVTNREKDLLIVSKSDPRRPTAVDITIGQKIREQRLSKGLTQEELAKNLGVTQHQIQKNETGENRVAASRLVEISKILETPVTWFLEVFVSAGTTHIVTERKQGCELEDELIKAFLNLSPRMQRNLVRIARTLGKT
jgi:transcriptional regulator with XRE-family HTH domain